MKDHDFIKVVKLLLILVFLYLLMLAIECIVGSFWKLFLFLGILLIVLWCFYRKKKAKSIAKGVLLLIILLLFLVWSIGPCVYERHFAELEKTELEEKQRAIQAEKWEKEFEEDMKKAQEKDKEEYDKRKVVKESNEAEKANGISTPVYNFKEDQDCSDFSNSTEATEFMKQSMKAGFGDHRLDRNKDGIACN
ncbi:excalibur calcium-binding domain-containing protein [Siminovitchia acidinfaciens]|nr:excalibur calcium-binding domain-containing protein [Siminovitchia acidinfaciens]